MRWFLPSKKEEAHQAGLVCINQTHQGISIAYAVSEDKNKLQIKGALHQNSETLAEKQNAIRRFVLEHGLEGMPCSYVLQNSDYILTLVDTPNVAKEEKNRAMQWLVREVINFPIDEAIIDSFEIPLARARDNIKMSYVAIIRRSLVFNIESLVKSSGLILKTIDIPELALRNIAHLFPEAKNGTLLVYLHVEDGKLIICQNGGIFFTRNVALKLSDLNSSKETTQNFIDNLSLEIQRSLDYATSTFRQNIAKSVLLTPSELNSHFQDMLQNSLNLPVKVIDLSSVLQFEFPINKEQQMDSLIAIGGAIREMN